MIIRNLLLLLCTILLSSCAAFSPAITSEQLADIETVHLYHQPGGESDQIEVAVPRSNVAMSAGFYGGIFAAIAGSAIDASIDEDRKKNSRAYEIKYEKMLGDFRLGPLIEQHLRKAVETTTTPSLTFHSDAPDVATLSTPGEKWNADALVFTKSRYWVAVDNGTLTVALNYWITLKENPTKVDEEALRPRWLFFKTRNEDWTSESLIEALENGARVVAEMAIFDMLDSRTIYEIKKFETRASIFADAKKIKVHVYRVGTSSDSKYIYYRFKDNGDLYAVPST